MEEPRLPHGGYRGAREPSFSTTFEDRLRIADSLEERQFQDCCNGGAALLALYLRCLLNRALAAEVIERFTSGAKAQDPRLRPLSVGLEGLLHPQRPSSLHQPLQMRRIMKFECRTRGRKRRTPGRIPVPSPRGFSLSNPLTQRRRGCYETRLAATRRGRFSRLPRGLLPWLTAKPPLHGWVDCVCFLLVHYKMAIVVS